jgi:signal transduction histidine kinase
VLKRLRLKFIVINMLIVTVLLFAILALVFHFTRQQMEESSVSVMRSIALEPSGLGRPDQDLEEPRLPFFTIQTDENGLVTAVEGGYYDLSDDQLLQTLTDTALVSDAQLGTIDQYQLRFYRVSVPEGTRIVFADMSYERATLESLWRTCIAIALVSFCLFLAVSVLLARWSVKPVERAWDQQRQFVADASHELKTPLAVITTSGELLASPNCDESEKARFTKNILTQARQMRALVEQLLELARADSVETELEPVDLSHVVESAALPFDPVFFERGLTLSSDIQPGLQVRGNAEQLGRLTAILLDNAQKYALGGETAVHLARQGRRQCLLTVTNPAQALTEEQLQGVFKRFYRVDPSRSGGGYGLGLAIAQSIVQAHHGKIWAENGEGTVTFSVSLPLWGV